MKTYEEIAQRIENKIKFYEEKIKLCEEGMERFGDPENYYKNKIHDFRKTIAMLRSLLY